MKHFISLLVLFALFRIPAPAQEGASKPLAVGDQAPDFTLPYATKDSIGSDDLKLSGLYGKRSIILAFYPADWSGGCTKEMCTMRDNFNALASLNAEILPISGDYEFSHHEWAKYHNLPFKLVADHSHKVARIYNTYNEERGFDTRAVYVIDKQGKIAYIDPKYSVRDSVSFEKLKAALKKMQ
jgi:peroxiredoxin